MVTFVTHIIKSTAKLRNYFHNAKLKYKKTEISVISHANVRNNSHLCSINNNK